MQSVAYLLTSATGTGLLVDSSWFAVARTSRLVDTFRNWSTLFPAIPVLKDN
jgi:hypothetical protein